jgi:hypothetical protein
MTEQEQKLVEQAEELVRRLRARGFDGILTEEIEKSIAEGEALGQRPWTVPLLEMFRAEVARRKIQ